MFFAKKPTEALLLRFGGLGDAVICTGVGNTISRVHQIPVDFAVRDIHAEVFEECPVFRKIYPVRRFQPGHVDTVEEELGWGTVEVLKQRYSLPLDLKNSIENNTMYPRLPFGPWVNSMNSNFFHWVDLQISWAGIDWTMVPDEWKRPILRLREEEKRWAERFMGARRPKIGVQLIASSLARTHYIAPVLPRVLNSHFGAEVWFWNGASWEKILYGEKVEEIKPTYRQTMAIVNNLDLVIAADSGVSHVAEALDTKAIVVYSTVPAWTRAKYYKNVVPLQSYLPCSPCITLDRYCPKRRIEAFETLSEREKKLMELQRKGTPLHEVARRFDSTPEGISREWEALNQRIEGLSIQQAYCLKELSVDDVLYEAEKILNRKEYPVKLKVLFIMPTRTRMRVKKISLDLENQRDLEITLAIVWHGKEKPGDFQVIFNPGGNYSSCLNRGLEAHLSKDFDFVVFSNDDVRIPRNSLTRLVKRALLSGCSGMGPYGAFHKAPEEEFEKISSYVSGIPSVEQVDTLSGFFLVVPFKIARRLRFDERLIYYEDNLYCDQLRKFGNYI
ncbi:MAG TPA: hypothetical protein EYP29_04975 [Thermoplasmata archaeon]|nr:hypothetical protein [Thermoplasmata archaeon]